MLPAIPRACGVVRCCMYSDAAVRATLILLRARNRSHYVGGSDNVLRARYVRVTCALRARYVHVIGSWGFCCCCSFDRFEYKNRYKCEIQIKT